MIRYTAGLGKCFRLLCPTHIFRVLEKQYRMVGDSVLSGDVVIRVIMWVVACHIQVWGTCVCGMRSFNSFSACFMLWLD